MKNETRRNVIISLITALVLIFVFFLRDYMTLQDNDKVLKVGFIYVGDGATAYTKNFMDAQDELEVFFGDRIECIAKYNIPDDKPIDQYVDELIKAGCDVIFSTSYGYGDDVKRIAAENPEVQFCQATASNANDDPVLSNYHTYMGHIYEGRYLAGVVAGMKLRELIEDGTITADEAVVGYVAAFPYSEVISGYTAFFMGVRSQCESATMRVKYTNTWNDFGLEKEYAEELIEEGCVIISQHSDTKGPAIACEQAAEYKTVYIVSYNASMIDVAPTTALTGCRINWFPYEKQVVQALLKGKNIEKSFNGKETVNGNDVGAGFSEGWIEMLDLNSVTVARGTVAKVETLKNKFTKERVPVFYGDYVGVDPFNPDDTIDLRTEYIENTKYSAPMFHYVLSDVITVD